MPRDRSTGRGGRGLFAGVLERRRAESSARAAQAPDDQADRIAALEARIDHLEALVEGLQDAAHRESVRRGKEMDELDRKTEPEEMSRSLARHARERGL